MKCKYIYCCLSFYLFHLIIVNVIIVLLITIFIFVEVFVVNLGQYGRKCIYFKCIFLFSV